MKKINIFQSFVGLVFKKIAALIDGLINLHKISQFLSKGIQPRTVWTLEMKVGAWNFPSGLEKSPHFTFS